MPRLIIMAVFFWAALGSCGILPAQTPAGAPDRILVFAPQLEHYSEKNDYARLFAEDLLKHWPQEKVTLRHFPEPGLKDPTLISRLLADLADDASLKAVVIGEAPAGCLDGLARLKARRPDLYLLVIDPHEGLEKMARVATLSLSLDHIARGYLYPVLARRMGARSLVLYSFPRHMELEELGRMQRVMTQACRDLGLILVSDLQGPDPGLPEADLADLEAYLEKTMGRYLEQYGPDTAFVATSTVHSDILVPAIMRQGGRSLPAVQSSLILGFPEALDLGDEARLLFGQWRRLLAVEDEKIMALNPPGQFASWVYPYPHTAMLAMVDMAVRAGEEKIDLCDPEALNDVLAKYSPGVKWSVRSKLDYHQDQPVPRALLLSQDSYWFGQGFQGFTRLNIPAKYYRLQ
ncbi:MAG: DUF3798 domain-containing protein [Candidatus Adiutrix sp.]|jgi:hypothetical protein|nr:DUF3798 domain-containing protein [Candidatus Adiutrix sp.]